MAGPGLLDGGQDGDPAAGGREVDGEEGKSQSRAAEFLDSVADCVDSAVSRARQA